LPDPGPGLEGTSLVPVLRAPRDEAGVKTAAFSQYPRCPSYNESLARFDPTDPHHLPHIMIRIGAQSGLTESCRMVDTDLHTCHEQVHDPLGMFGQQPSGYPGDGLQHPHQELEIHGVEALEHRCWFAQARADVQA
jgi:hypothetical protein